MLGASTRRDVSCRFLACCQAQITAMNSSNKDQRDQSKERSVKVSGL